MIRKVKVRAIELYAQHVQKQLEPLARGLAQQGCSEAEIGEAIEGLRPVFDKGIEDVLRQITVIGLECGANDNGWAEISVDMLRRAFERPEANPAILVKEIAAGLALMERTGIYERDGRLYFPDESSPIARVDWRDTGGRGIKTRSRSDGNRAPTEKIISAYPVRPARARGHR